MKFKALIGVQVTRVLLVIVQRLLKTIKKEENLTSPRVKLDAINRKIILYANPELKLA